MKTICPDAFDELSTCDCHDCIVAATARQRQRDQDQVEPLCCNKTYNNIEHDSHCNICGNGQYDIGNEHTPPPQQRDDLSWCRKCSADICGNCNCGHDDWGA